jgi:hypothetical protein
MEGIGRYFERFRAIAGTFAADRELAARIVSENGIPCTKEMITIDRGVASVRLQAAARSEFTLSRVRILDEFKKAGLKVSEIRAIR